MLQAEVFMKRKFKQRQSISTKVTLIFIDDREVHYYTVAYSIQQYFTFQSMAYCVVFGLNVHFEKL